MERLEAIPVDMEGIDAKVALIQELIPPGLIQVEEELKREVAALTGPRYARRDGRPAVVRYGKQPGSAYLADQKLGIKVPGVRDLGRNQGGFAGYSPRATPSSASQRGSTAAYPWRVELPGV